MTGDVVLSDADRRILRVLQENGRIANVDLADRVGMSASPCLRRVRGLEASGVIRGYRADLDRRALGYGVEAFAFVMLDQQTLEGADALRRRIAALEPVTACWAMTGEIDLMLHVVATDLESYGRFTMNHLLALDGVRDVRSSFVIGKIKDGPVLPVG